MIIEKVLTRKEVLKVYPWHEKIVKKFGVQFIFKTMGEYRIWKKCRKEDLNKNRRYFI